jgi:beta-galactosidase
VARHGLGHLPGARIDKRLSTSNLGPLLGDRLPHLMYGGDYNPEQWPESVWEEDVRLMQEAGVNLVSLAVFSWARLEPTAGSYEFAWLDRVIELLHEGGIKLNLATATASPPPWLSHKHPEMLPVTAEGVRLWPGARQHYCPSSPVYRDAARRLVEQMSDHYSEHPALAMWHVGNEYGCHVAECYCDVSAHAFRRWLQDRYGSLGELNRVWATDFWAQRYSSWEEILPPRSAPTLRNPGRQLDFMRFSSDELLDCYEIEREVLLARSPGIPITTNFMRFFKPIDYWKWADREDVVSDDVYQDPLDPEAGMRSAMAGDLMRSLGRGRPWVLMEQTTSSVNWRPINAAKAPGEMRLWSFQAVARGADGVMFYQWRQSRGGAEKHHSAMVPHGKPESSSTWREVVRLGGELAKLDTVCGSRVRAEVAMLHDWDSWWALELPSKPSDQVRHLDRLEASYRPLFEANVVVDFARAEDELSGYKVVLAPSLYLVSDEGAANLNRFVEAGGTLVLGFFSGIVDPNEQVRLGGYPAPFKSMLGLEVEEFLPLGPGRRLGLTFRSGPKAQGDTWSERIHLHGAESIVDYADGLLAGQAAVTRHRHGEGTAYYLSTSLEAVALARLLQQVCDEAGVAAPKVPAGVEAVRRHGARSRLLFLLNHRDVDVEVPLADPGVNLVDGADVHRGLLRLGPRGVAVIREGW